MFPSSLSDAAWALIEPLMPVWDRVHDALRDQVRIAAGRDLNPSAGVLDAQSIKSSEGGEERGFDAGKKTTGRKRHLVVDTLGLVLTVMVTSASVQDRLGGRLTVNSEAMITIAMIRLMALRLTRQKAHWPNRIERKAERRLNHDTP